MKKGQKVRFIGVECKEQIQWGGNTNPEGLLKTSDIYIVENYEIHSWHTKLFLKDIKGQFNPLWFEEVVNES
jgi:hypothetical protein